MIKRLLSYRVSLFGWMFMGAAVIATLFDHGFIGMLWAVLACIFLFVFAIFYKELERASYPTKVTKPKTFVEDFHDW